MAAVDALLRVMSSQNADALSLASGQAPRLVRAGSPQPLSMPAVTATLMETFVGEVLSDELRDEARRSGAVTVDYADMTATVRRVGDSWAMSFKRRPRAAAAAASPAPVRATVPAPTPTPGAPPTPAPPPPVTPGSDDLAGGLLEHWIGMVLAENASDLLISAGRPARMRSPRGWEELPGAALDSDQLHALLGRALGEAHQAALGRHGSCDLAWTFVADGQRTRFRVNLFRQASGLAAAFRPVRRDVPTLAGLGLPESLTRLVEYPNGLVLVTGPTGSGKSTTLVALIEHLARTTPCHILTIEDPIEYEYTAPHALVHQREVGVHVDSFEAGLRAALREAPDVILVGEMRDRATIAAALTAAETGHLVLSTLHAAGAAMAVERIVDVFPEHQQQQVRTQLAQTLRAVLTQVLVPATRPGLRVPAIELLVSTAATSALIRENKTHQLASAIQTGRDDGMIPFDRSLADLVEARRVTQAAASAVTLDGGRQLAELIAAGRGR